MKRKLTVIIGAALVYLLLLMALVAAEGAAADATIRTFWDAVWYSIITLTTVGYGDLSPVTPLGRVLGLLFALCSLGVLSAMIGLLLSLLRRQFWPRFRLRRGNTRPWYVFFDSGAYAQKLADDLAEAHPEALLVFACPEGAEAPESSAGRIGIRAGVKEILELRGNAAPEKVSFFFMGENESRNYTDAMEAARLAGAGAGPVLYCMADPGRDSGECPSVPMHFFSREECISRRYWRENPLREKERCVVFLSCGRTGKELLLRALLINVGDRNKKTEYHVFGETAEFAVLHPEIVKALNSPGDPDSLFLHENSWKEEREILERADRILLCADTDRENMECSDMLHKWFVTPGQVHVCLSSEVPGLRCFGTDNDVFSEEFVMMGTLNRQAEILNAIYNEGSSAKISLDSCSRFVRQSNIVAADHLGVKIRWLLKDETITEVTPENCRKAFEVYRSADQEAVDCMQEMEHRRWMRFQQMYNWEYAPVRDNALRHHPLLVPYDDLPEKEKVKDLYAWELLGRLGKEKET